MANTNAPKSGDVRALREDWVARLSTLVDDVELWAKQLDWATRRVDKKMQDSEIGDYRVPVLLLQKETVRILLEPIARSAPGAEGVVDLYLMPAYDDIASLYYCDAKWHLHYMFTGTPTVGTTRDAEAQLLTKESLESVLKEMKANAA